MDFYTLLFWENGLSENEQDAQRLLAIGAGRVRFAFYDTICEIEPQNLLPCLQLYVAQGGPCNALDPYNRTLLHEVAARSTNWEPIHYLLQAGARLDARDAQGVTPLHEAARHSKIDLFRQWVKQPGFDAHLVDHNGMTLLHKAVQNPNIEVMQLLLTKYRVNVHAQTCYKQSALHLACEYKRPRAFLHFLIRSGAKVNQQDYKRRTPLHYAAAYIHPSLELITELIEQGAKINVVDDYGQISLHLAVRYTSQIEVVRLLLQQGALVNHKDKEGRTPLHYAVVYNSDVSAMKVLVERGAWINEQDHKGNTPLHMTQLQVKKVHWLLAHKANPFIKNAANHMPFHHMILYSLYHSGEARNFFELIKLFFAYFTTRALNVMQSTSELNILPHIIAICSQKPTFSKNIFPCLLASGSVSLDAFTELSFDHFSQLVYFQHHLYEGLRATLKPYDLNPAQIKQIFAMSSTLRVRLNQYFLENQRRHSRLTRDSGRMNAAALGSTFKQSIVNRLFFTRYQTALWSYYLFASPIDPSTMRLATLFSDSESKQWVRYMITHLPVELIERIRHEIVVSALTDYIYVHDQEKEIDLKILRDIISNCIQPNSELFRLFQDCIQWQWKPSIISSNATSPTIGYR